MRWFLLVMGKFLLNGRAACRGSMLNRSLTQPSKTATLFNGGPSPPARVVIGESDWDTPLPCRGIHSSFEFTPKKMIFASAPRKSARMMACPSSKLTLVARVFQFWGETDCLVVYL